MLNQFVRFILVGGLATGIQYAILILLTETRLAEAVVASTAGYLVSSIFNYAMNHRFTFDSDESHGAAIVKFYIVAGAGLLLNSGLMYLGLYVVGLHYLLGQVVATVCVLAWHFVAHRAWTYRRSTRTT